MRSLEFGSCKNCGHPVVNFNSKWLHHITRSNLLGLPHWPAGHIITVDCKWKCNCSIPELDQAKPLKTKLVYLGSRTDR
ncbi:MAG: hypothetical protein AMDU4_FER2C00201G0008 [Ferroplasma sp. Type II]|nr:MAG: hypothetical protein AMDU4_FER2C00201G0008 [Ferroplasma sp. Type II]